ncbi:MAG: hypothetical protein C4527_25705 [Candidatus Omnitrophota bacterium]|jgi:hypothetical protein|nr:MAG: hypothetical protein C4527_25705 [Candidatus Omnitrophota bacterium]
MLSNQDYFSNINVGSASEDQPLFERFEIELVDKLENLLDEFYFYLMEKGLKSSTIEKHTANAELFLVQYHAFQYLKGVESITADEVYDFLGLWYFQKILYPTRRDILSILTSLKRLLSFISEEELIGEDLAAELKNACGDKSFFLKKLEEFENNPPLYEEEEWEEDDFQDFVDDFIGSISTEEEEPLDDMLQEELEEKSLIDIMAYLRDMVGPMVPRNNVISLETKLPQKPGVAKPSSQDHKSRSTTDALKEHSLALHRSNLIFIRWLDRYNIHPADLPADAFRTCVILDNLISILLIRLEEEIISKTEIDLGHEMLELIDRMLWAARQTIAGDLDLDLRLLPL